MASAVISLNTNNYFTEFALNPLSEKLDKNDQMIALITTIALSILTGGLFPLLALLFSKNEDASPPVLGYRDMTPTAPPVSTIVGTEDRGASVARSAARLGASALAMDPLEVHNRALRDAVIGSERKPVLSFGDFLDPHTGEGEVPAESKIFEGIYVGGMQFVEHALYTNEISQRSPQQAARLAADQEADAADSEALARDPRYFREHREGAAYMLHSGRGEFRPDVVISLNGERAGDEGGGFQPYPQLPARTGIEHHSFCLMDSGEGAEQLVHKERGGLSVYEQVKQVLDRARVEGKTVLVHCSAGQSRSAGTVAKYIAEATGVSFEQALHFVGTNRPDVGFRSGFCTNLARS